MSQSLFKVGDRVWYQKRVGLQGMSVQKHLGGGEVVLVFGVQEDVWYRTRFDAPGSELDNMFIHERYLVLENPLEALAQAHEGEEGRCAQS